MSGSCSFDRLKNGHCSSSPPCIHSIIVGHNSNAEWKKLDPRQHILYDSISRKLKKQAKVSRGRDASGKTKKTSQEVISIKVRTAETPGQYLWASVSSYTIAQRVFLYWRYFHSKTCFKSTAKYICYFDSPDSSVHGYFGSTFFLCDLIHFFFPPQNWDANHLFIT